MNSKPDSANPTPNTLFDLVVKSVERVTDDSVSIVFSVVDEAKPNFTYKAGQYISLYLQHNEEEIVRSYSLSSAPKVDADLTISVKRIKGGLISNLLNDSAKPGDQIKATVPTGNFTIADTDQRVVFFAGGSGITPIYSMIKWCLAQTDLEIRLIYANRSQNSVMFKDGLDGLLRAFPNRFYIDYHMDDVDGFLDLHTVKKIAYRDADARFYLCGPGRFMAIVEEGLNELHVPSENIKSEIFATRPEQSTIAPGSSPADIGDPSTEKIVLRINSLDHEISYRAGESILQCALRSGLEPDHLCQSGYCSSCAARLLSGAVDMKENTCLTPELLQEGWILMCQSKCTSGPVLVEHRTRNK